ncbi:GTP cyclohydrolase FolE2 [bacterium]|nr:GTP cyclohydrolase FolE2 [bacterium]
MTKLGEQHEPWQTNGTRRSGRTLPDVAKTNSASVAGELDRVGMAGIDVALRRRDENGHVILTPAKADAFVSLDDPEAKGIHMSRLFLRLHESLDREELSPGLIQKLLSGFVESHSSLSKSSALRLSYSHLWRRPALLSDHAAWRNYPVTIESRIVEGKVQHQLSVVVTYSSTCPCSAALARQLLREQFEHEFAGQEMVAPEQVAAWIDSERMTYPTPHSQRSHAEVTVILGDAHVAYPVNDLIDTVESAIATAVQTVVKRQDEQQFAKINGENLMFCEDAARRIREAVEKLDYAADYRIRVDHLESLHPHDAVAIVTKGVPGGLQA